MSENPIFDCCRENTTELLTHIDENPQNVHAGNCIVIINKVMENPIFDCCRRNRTEELSTLIKENPQYIHAKDLMGSTPLHVVVCHRSVESLKILLEAGGDINAKNNNGDTPLHIAACHRSVECGCILLEWRADTTIKNNQGLTFLDCIQDEQEKKEIEKYINSLSTSHLKEPSC